MRGMLTVSRRHLPNQQGVGGDRQIGSAGGRPVPRPLQRPILGSTLGGDLGFRWLAQRSVADTP
jgi:hypothetical protein